MPSHGYPTRESGRSAFDSSTAWSAHGASGRYTPGRNPDDATRRRFRQGPWGRTHEVTPGWKIVPDSSISPKGWELVSPVLCGLRGLAEVVKIFRTLNDSNIEIPADNTSCGAHVHIGADDLDGNAVANLICFHDHIEQHGLLMCVPQSRRQNRYCKRTDQRILDKAKAGPITFEEARGITSDTSRCFSLNMFKRCADYGTVEFRRHGSSTDPAKLLAWIVLKLHMVSAASHLRRPNYGSNFAECLDAIGLDQNGLLAYFARCYLLARWQKFNRIGTPDLPGTKFMEGLLALAQSPAMDIPSYSMRGTGPYVPFSVPRV